MKKILLFSPTGMVGCRLMERLKNTDHRIFYWQRNKYDIPDENIDIFIYVAGITSGRHETAKQYVVDNCYMAAKVVDACKQCNVKRIIFLSSDEVYGNLDTDSLSADSDRINPGVYASSKYLSEQIIMESEIPYYIIRSPGIVDGTKIKNSFLERTAIDLSQNRTITCNHMEDLFNNVVHLEDLCKFILLLTNKENDDRNKIFHVGQCESEKLTNIINYMRNQIESNSKILAMSKKGRHFTLPVEDAVEYGYASRGIYPIIDEIVMMLRSRISGKNVEFVEKALYYLDNEQINYIKNKARNTAMHKYRVCLHEGIDDKMHVMLSAYPRYAYVKPHFHPGKSELKIIVEGSVLVIIYDDSGQEKNRSILSQGETDILYIRQGIAHTNIPLTDCLLLEVTPGPFDRANDSVFLNGFPENMEMSDVETIFVNCK